ncbi:hypothetical protein [Antrihabitans cavernicola]|uniref:hypothetical protein n=1 Tax=Antrihabitans cavernicola TaxID=2495913 RepID=UPI001F284426|nr:hypothetical protein [Spelaeibacter cavernicola]
MPVPVAFTELAGLSRQERLEQLRRRMAAVPARGESVTEHVPLGEEHDSRGVLDVPPALADLLPRRGLSRGSVVTLSGADSLLLGLLASTTGAGAHAVVIGRPRLGLLAAAEMGAQLGRIAVIPDPGPDPVEVAAVLLDGMDVVVLSLGGNSVNPSRARAVIARARSKGSILIVADGHWSGAELRLDARVIGYDGLGRGTGRVRSMRLVVQAQGRAFGPATARLDLQSVDGRIEWVPEVGAEPAERPGNTAAIPALPAAVSL